MIISLAELLEREKIELEDTAYSDSNKNFLEYQLVAGDFYSWEKDTGLMWFKNCVQIVDFSYMERMIPQLSGLNYQDRDNLSYLVLDLEELKTAIEDGRQIGIEGGPCLFGAYEVMTEVVLKDGECICFDYSTGNRSQKLMERELSLESRTEDKEFAEYLLENSDHIQKVKFYNRKDKITTQEYMALKYLFEYAKVLDAKLMITIPDMSYIKYLKAGVMHMDEMLAKEIVDEFKRIAYSITDMYIEVIQKLEKEYPMVEYEIFHERNEELCQLFYEKRVEFIERNRVLKDISRSKHRVESVKDYISMPALPYYRWGITDILEMNSQDETDSYRKGKKAHKSKIKMSGILYPEFLSKNKKQTIFYAPLEYKEYIE